jgi:hypothetical protein
MYNVGHQQVYNLVSIKHNYHYLDHDVHPPSSPLHDRSSVAVAEDTGGNIVHMDIRISTAIGAVSRSREYARFLHRYANKENHSTVIPGPSLANTAPRHILGRNIPRYRRKSSGLPGKATLELQFGSAATFKVTVYS